MIVFINYISRSGSTYLCKLLDEYEEIGVAIEAGFPGFTKHLILPEFNPIVDDKHLEQYLDLLFKDIRFRQWNIDGNQLLNKIKNHSFPLRFNIILKSIFELYFKDQNYSIWVHKAGYYVECFEDVNLLFPESKSIFIVRDPRAIYNSMKSAKDIYSGKLMGGNILSFVSLYKRRIKLIKQMSNLSNFHSIRYEDLILDPSSTLCEIIDFVGLLNRNKKETSDYSQKIPDNQKQLHTNVCSDPMIKNIDKWQSGLGKIEISFIQLVLSEELDQLGYKKLELRIDWNEFIKTRMLLINWHLLKIRNMIEKMLSLH